MRFPPRRTRRALVVFAFVVGVPVLMVSGASPVPKDCQALLAWARSAYASGPPTFDQLATFDRPHRNAIFAAITPAARASLWREQLRRFAGREVLTVPQRAFVDESIGVLTPDYYAMETTARAEIAQSLSTRGRALFTSRTHAAAFTDLAGPHSGARIEPPSGWSRLANPFTAAAQNPWCQCSTVDSWPECNSGCISPPPCQGFTPGCGFAGSYECNGMCIEG